VDDQIFQRIIGTVESLLRDIGADPYHPLRAAFDTALRDFVDRLQHAPDVIAKAEAMKENGFQIRPSPTCPLACGMRPGAPSSRTRPGRTADASPDRWSAV